MPTPAFEAMNRRSLVEQVQKHNDAVKVIRSYSRKSKAELLQELRRVYPLVKPKAKPKAKGKAKPKAKEEEVAAAPPASSPVQS
jgi:hypothetical protein